ncbi:MAG: DNA-3-methyladenine glycosylase I [Pseudomonadota bacterium]
MIRCSWAQNSASEEQYHDHEWGVPVHDERRLFEFLTLEGAQAGLSWATILNKREGYRKAFDHFEIEKVSRYNTKKVEKLLLNPEIVRNKLKVNAAIANAKAFIAIQHEFNSFDHYIWKFVDGKPIQNTWQNESQVPAHSIISDAMSKDLKKRGFKFVGTIICYAFMQAIGMVNDHTTNCFRYKQIKTL